MAQRLQAEAALVVTGGVFVCLATLASRTAWLAAVAPASVTLPARTVTALPWAFLAGSVKPT